MKFSTQVLYKVMIGLFIGMGAIIIWIRENFLYFLVGMIFIVIGITLMDKYALLENLQTKK